MRYTVNARAQSIITAALAMLLAAAIQLSAAARADAPTHSTGVAATKSRAG